ncbi:MAG: hypothetical protein JSS09_05975, partial [Verrucomicrobia bacterium]|nr:hypothetical protein [Verrucomicrobiota bacterium]
MSRVFSNNKIFNRFLSTGGAGIEKTNFENENVANINVSRSVSLNGTKVSGDVGARGSITAANATVQGEINAGGSITAINSIAEELNAGGSVTAVSVKVFSKV